MCPVRRQVLICSGCDGGQQYCGAGCSDLARRESMRAARRRYQHSRRARHCHGERQRRYRRRRRAGGGLPRESDASRFRSVAMRCSTPAPTSSQARGEPCDVPQPGHQASSRSERNFKASSRSERNFHNAVPLLRTSDQRVRACSLATLTDSSARSPRRTALNAAHDGDQRRTQGADPARPLRRALAGGHHRLAARRPPLHRRAGAGRGRRAARASAPATGLEARPLQSVHHRDAGALPHPDRRAAVRQGQGEGLHGRSRPLPTQHRAATPAPAP